MVFVLVLSGHEYQLRRRHSQVVRQRSAKPPFPGSNPGAAFVSFLAVLSMLILLCLKLVSCACRAGIIQLTQRTENPKQGRVIA